MKLLMTGFMFLLYLFPMMEGGGWGLLKLHVPFWEVFVGRFKPGKMERVSKEKFLYK